MVFLGIRARLIIENYFKNLSNKPYTKQVRRARININEFVSACSDKLIEIYRKQRDSFLSQNVRFRRAVSNNILGSKSF